MAELLPGAFEQRSGRCAPTFDELTSELRLSLSSAVKGAVRIDRGSVRPMVCSEAQDFYPEIARAINSFDALITAAALRASFTDALGKMAWALLSNIAPLRPSRFRDVSNGTTRSA